ncbi:MAG: DUF692 family protein, partial [Candidatus Eremiobacteraeota bacterium]|nr:DUF692 family protein [Candidatus Eremiobacteraeota bacterium]
IDVIPDRLWYDFEHDAAPGGRFHRVTGAIQELKECAQGRVLGGHGIGLSLPSAIPMDMQMVAAASSLARELGFKWYSEHLSMFLVSKGSVPNSQAGLGLPVTYDEEMFEVIRGKLEVLKTAMGCDLLLENGAVFTPVPDTEMSETEFLNRLYSETDCGVLLDLHNLYVGLANGILDPVKYLEALDPESVKEIHLAGGHELAGFYMDSHSGLTPRDVWDWAYQFGPRFRNLQAIVFEFYESYFEKLELAGITGELQRMHALAEAVAGASTT